MSTSEPCDLCDGLFLRLDVEWATKYAEVCRQRDNAFATLYALRRSLYDAERTLDIEGHYGMKAVRADG